MDEYNLLENDTVITREKSEATIYWPDRSTTYLGENSAFTIHTMKVSADYTSIILEASLVQGKMYTSVVRTLYPDSKMTVHLPAQGIIAGVRGTDFSINLDAGYIHSIDHVVSLQNNFLRKVSLLPGEVVSSSDIFTKVGVELIDHIWEDSVELKNSVYEAAHSDAVQKAWEKLAGNINSGLWDKFVRFILSKFDAFAEIEIIAHISSDADKLLNYGANELLGLYQKFKFGDFAKERDVIRGAIFTLSEADKSVQKFLEVLASESLWDKLEFPTLDLTNSEKILDQFGQKMTIDIDGLLEKMSDKNYGNEVLNSIDQFFGIKK